MPRTRKITMTVYCLEEDTESVREDLIEEWYNGNNAPLASIDINIEIPTAEEDMKACQSLDEIPLN